MSDGAKVMLKSSFYHPNIKQRQSNNIGYLTYIATRPGVDKTVTENDLESELNPSEKEMSTSNQYVHYIDKRERSHGLFGANGIEHPNDVAKEFKQDTVAWRFIVSLREEDAVQLGYTKKDTWEDLLRKKMPDVANTLGIKLDNFRWVAAVHMERGHPHTHVMFWEKNRTKTMYEIPEMKLQKTRKMFTDEIFAQERSELLIHKNAMRDLLVDCGKESVKEAALLIQQGKISADDSLFLDDKESKKIAPKMDAEFEKKLTSSIINIADKLPKKGRQSFGFMPPEIKDELIKIVDSILEQPEYYDMVNRFENSVTDLTSIYNTQHEAISQAQKNALTDLKKRIAQDVIHAAVTLQKTSNIIKTINDPKETESVKQSSTVNECNYISDSNASESSCNANKSTVFDSEQSTYNSVNKESTSTNLNFKDNDTLYINPTIGASAATAAWRGAFFALTSSTDNYDSSIKELHRSYKRAAIAKDGKKAIRKKILAKSSIDINADDTHELSR